VCRPAAGTGEGRGGGTVHGLRRAAKPQLSVARLWWMDRRSGAAVTGGKRRAAGWNKRLGWQRRQGVALARNNNNKSNDIVVMM